VYERSKAQRIFKFAKSRTTEEKAVRKKMKKKRERKEILNMVKEEKTTKIRRTSRRLYP